MDENSFGVLWDGQYEALNRLILGLGFDIGDALVGHGVPPQSAGELQSNLAKDLYATLAVPAMPIQDAIDLARFLVETTIGFVRFAVFLPKSVGGPQAIWLVSASGAERGRMAGRKGRKNWLTLVPQVLQQQCRCRHFVPLRLKELLTTHRVRCYCRQQITQPVRGAGVEWQHAAAGTAREVEK